MGKIGTNLNPTNHGLTYAARLAATYERHPGCLSVSDRTFASVAGVLGGLWVPHAAQFYVAGTITAL
jgi:hypothetical protein